MKFIDLDKDIIGLILKYIPLQKLDNFMAINPKLETYFIKYFLTDYVKRDRKLSKVRDSDRGLCYSAARGCKFFTFFYLNMGADQISRAAQNTLIHGHNELAKYLINKGANDYDRLLNIAVEKGNYEMTQFILARCVIVKGRGNRCKEVSIDNIYTLIRFSKDKAIENLLTTYYNKI